MNNTKLPRNRKDSMNAKEFIVALFITLFIIPSFVGLLKGAESANYNNPERFCRPNSYAGAVIVPFWASCYVGQFLFKKRDFY